MTNPNSMPEDATPIVWRTPDGAIHFNGTFDPAVVAGYLMLIEAAKNLDQAAGKGKTTAPRRNPPRKKRRNPGLGI